MPTTRNGHYHEPMIHSTTNTAWNSLIFSFNNLANLRLMASHTKPGRIQNLGRGFIRESGMDVHHWGPGAEPVKVTALHAAAKNNNLSETGSHSFGRKKFQEFSRSFVVQFQNFPGAFGHSSQPNIKHIWTAIVTKWLPNIIECNQCQYLL